MADKRLGELLLRGWTMLAENCSVCNCPLMRNPDGKKYCVQCEAWVYDNKKREEKKFTELFPTQGNQPKKDIPKNNVITQKKETTEKVEKKENKENKEKKIEEKIEEKPKPNNKNTCSGSVLELLDNKLKLLGQSLNEESDIKKSEEIIQLMDKIIAIIDHYKKVNS